MMLFTVPILVALVVLAMLYACAPLMLYFIHQRLGQLLDAEEHTSEQIRTLTQALRQVAVRMPPPAPITPESATITEPAALGQANGCSGRPELHVGAGTAPSFRLL